MGWSVLVFVINRNLISYTDTLLLLQTLFVLQSFQFNLWLLWGFFSQNKASWLFCKPLFYMFSMVSGFKWWRLHISGGKKKPQAFIKCSLFLSFTLWHIYWWNCSLWSTNHLWHTFLETTITHVGINPFKILMLTKKEKKKTF